MKYVLLLIFVFWPSFPITIDAYRYNVYDNRYEEPTTENGYDATSEGTPACQENYSCVDCNTVRICRPTEGKQSLEELAVSPCPYEAPWCDSQTGTCVLDQPAHCLVPTDFICMRDGLFPDLEDCASYYQCIEGMAYLFNCPTNAPFYNAISEYCERSNSSCAPNSICKEKDGVKARIITNKQVFAYCVGGSVVSMDRCIGHYQFNQLSQSCEPHCPHFGLFPGNDSCTHYYKCSSTSRSKWAKTFTISHHVCPHDHGFLEESHECVHKDRVPNCGVMAAAMSRK